jgi:hypothetical protein
VALLIILLVCCISLIVHCLQLFKCRLVFLAIDLRNNPNQMCNSSE